MKKNVIVLYCDNAEHKEQIKKAAKASRMSVNQYVLRSVTIGMQPKKQETSA